MKQVSGKELAKMIASRGWVLRRISGSHHIFLKDGESNPGLYDTTPLGLREAYNDKMIVPRFSLNEKMHSPVSQWIAEVCDTLRGRLIFLRNTGGVGGLNHRLGCWQASGLRKPFFAEISLGLRRRCNDKMPITNGVQVSERYEVPASNHNISEAICGEL